MRELLLMFSFVFDLSLKKIHPQHIVCVYWVNPKFLIMLLAYYRLLAFSFRCDFFFPNTLYQSLGIVLFQEDVNFHIYNPLGSTLAWNLCYYLLLMLPFCFWVWFKFKSAKCPYYLDIWLNIFY